MDSFVRNEIVADAARMIVIQAKESHVSLREKTIEMNEKSKLYLSKIFEMSWELKNALRLQRDERQRLPAGQAPSIVIPGAVNNQMQSEMVLRNFNELFNLVKTTSTSLPNFTHWLQFACELVQLVQSHMSIIFDRYSTLDDL